MEGERLDRFLCRYFPRTRRSFVRDALAAGDIVHNGRPGLKGRPVRAGDRVLVRYLLEEGDPWVRPEPDASVRVLALTASWVAVDKPAGQPVQPQRPGQPGTLAGALAARFPECMAVGETDTGMGGILHRLDTGTSGIVLVARTVAAWQALRSQFRHHQVVKRYVAIVEGRVQKAGHIAYPLAHDPHYRGRMLVVTDPTTDLRWFPAVTEFQPVAYGPRRTKLEITIRTGVTHQIRTHLASIGFPIVGDDLYGVARDACAGRLALHAARIWFTDPDTAAPREVESPVPPELDALLSAD